MSAPLGTTASPPVPQPTPEPPRPLPSSLEPTNAPDMVSHSPTKPVTLAQDPAREVTPRLESLSLSSVDAGPPLPLSLVTVFTQLEARAKAKCQAKLLHRLLRYVSVREVIETWPTVCKAFLPELRDFALELNELVEEERYCLDISWYLDNAENVSKWWKVRSCDIVLEGKDTVEEWINTGFWKADPSALSYVLIHDHRKKHKAELSIFHSYWDGLKHFDGLRSVKVKGAVRLWPKSDGYGLHRLQKLNLVSCYAVDAAFGFEMCTNLVDLTLNKVSDMKDCSSVGKASNLKRLEMHLCCDIVTMKGIERCLSLEELKLSWCMNLEYLGDLSGCVKLVYVEMVECPQVAEVSALSKCPELRRLKLDTLNIETLGSFANAKSLEYLEVIFCPIEKGMPRFDNGNHLRVLKLSQWAVGIPLGLDLLEYVVLNDCHIESFDVFQACKVLRTAVVKRCFDLSSLNGIQLAQSLEDFTLASCSEVDDYGYIGEVPNLRRLRIKRSEFPAVFVLGECKALEDLSLMYCNNIKTLSGVEELRLTRLHLHHLAALVDLTPLHKSDTLEELHVLHCAHLETLVTPKNLKKMKLEYLNLLCELSGVQDGLVHVELRNCHKLRSIQALEVCAALETCCIADCMALDSVSVLEALTALKEVRISGCHILQQAAIGEALTQRKGLSFYMQAYTEDELNYLENFIVDVEEEDDDHSLLDEA